MIEIIAQIIGIMAAAVSIISYQCKNNKALYILQGLSGLLFALNFLLLGAVTAAYMNIINLFRGTLFSFGKKLHKLPVSIALIAGYIVVTIITYEDFLSIVILLAVICGTLSMATRNGKTIRIVQFAICSPSWLVHNIIKFSIGGIITEVFSMLSIIISFLRYGKNGFEKQDDDI